VVFETKSGLVVIKARVVVDCTGDGDLAARAGPPFEVGRESDNLVQPMTLMFRMVEFERAAFLRRYVPGFERAYVAQSGVHTGVRETRKIIGDYQLTAADVLDARKFDDVITRGAYPIDIDNPAGSGTILQRLPPGEVYDIPLRCLLPHGVDGFVMAGRCISGTHEAHSSYRVMPMAMAMGQAAGVCAALMARAGKTPRDMPVADV